MILKMLLKPTRSSKGQKQEISPHDHIWKMLERVNDLKLSGHKPQTVCLRELAEQRET